MLATVGDSHLAISNCKGTLKTPKEKYLSDTVI
jgi:hypothetical protein